MTTQMLQNFQKTIENDEEVKELLNRPENDSAMSLSGLLNFPELLKLNTMGQHTYNSDAEDSDNEHYPPSHSRRDRPKSPVPTDNKRCNWTFTPLHGVRLPQLYQPSGAESYCIPPSSTLPRLWAGFSLEEELTNFLREHIRSCEDESNICETTTEQKLESKEGTVSDVRFMLFHCEVGLLAGDGLYRVHY